MVRKIFKNIFLLYEHFDYNLKFVYYYFFQIFSMFIKSQNYIFCFYCVFSVISHVHFTSFKININSNSVKVRLHIYLVFRISFKIKLGGCFQDWVVFREDCFLK